MTEELKLQAIAYHEVGHAVVAALKKLPVKYVSIVPTTDNIGSCQIDTCKYTIDNCHRLRDASFDIIAYLKAGKIVENKYLSSIDAADIEQLLSNSSYDDEYEIEIINNKIKQNSEAPINLDDVAKDVICLIDKPGNWTFIQKLSDILLIEKEFNAARLHHLLSEIIDGC